MRILPTVVLAGFAASWSVFARAETPGAADNQPSVEEPTSGPPHYIFADDKWVQEISTYSDFTELLSQTVMPQHTVLKSGLAMSPDDQLIMVMFYADWCPHCHRAAPVWSGVANLYHCTPGIRFFAFECSQSTPDRQDASGKTPLQTCMDFGIKSFPTFYAFSAENLPAEMMLSKDETNQVVEYAIEDTEEEFNVTTSRVVFDGPLDRLTFVGVNGTEADTSSVVLQQHVQLATRSVSSFRRWIAEKSRITDVRRCVLQSDFVAPTAVPLPARDNLSANIYEVKRWNLDIEKQPADELYADALNAFLFLLRNWAVDSDDGLTPARSKALQNILATAAKVLPGANVRAAMAQLKAQLELPDENATLPTADYFEKLDHFEVAGLTVPDVEGKYPQFRHMPRISSALWLFFHVMSTGYYVAAEPARAAALMNVPQAPVGQPGSEALDISAWDVASAVKDTVSNFFGCDVCRVHFMHFFDACYANLCLWVRDGHGPVHNDDTDGLLLWLWRFHNAVSFRTAVERSSDAVVSAGDSGTQKLVSFAGQDVRFPPADLCKECRTVNITDSSAAARAHLNPAEFTVSPMLLDQAVAWERMVRGIDVGDFNALNATGGSVNDQAWDKFEDFDLRQTEAFLVQRFWKPEWLKRDINLRWQPREKLFAEDQLRHLYTSPARGPNPSRLMLCAAGVLPAVAAASLYYVRPRTSRRQSKDSLCKLRRHTSEQEGTVVSVPEREILA